jgi:hypothetical protein
VLPGRTGLELPLLPRGVSAAGVDLDPRMLARAWSRLPLPGRDIELVQADALQFLCEHPGAFDAAVQAENQPARAAGAAAAAVPIKVGACNTR